MPRAWRVVAILHRETGTVPIPSPRPGSSLRVLCVSANSAFRCKPHAVQQRTGPIQTQRARRRRGRAEDGWTVVNTREAENIAERIYRYVESFFRRNLPLLLS